MGDSVTHITLNLQLVTWVGNNPTLQFSEVKLIVDYLKLNRNSYKIINFYN